MHYGNAETPMPLLAVWIALIAALTVGGSLGCHRWRLAFDLRWARSCAAERRGTRLAHEHASDADVLGGKRQQRQLAGALEGHVQRTLMRGARARLTPRLDLAAFG